MFLSRRLIGTAAIAATAGALMAPTTSMGATASDPVTGTTVGTVALGAVANAGFGTALRPGASFSNAGTVVVTSTNPVWSLNAHDSVGTAGTTPGKLDATTPGVGTCVGSANSLANAMSVEVTGTGVQSGGIKPLTGAAADSLVAFTNTTNPLPVAAATLNSNYTQTIGAAEVLTTGCIYSMTVVYTLQ